MFGFELQDALLPSSTGILDAAQRQTAVAAHLTSKQLLLFTSGYFSTTILALIDKQQ